MAKPPKQYESGGVGSGGGGGGGGGEGGGGNGTGGGGSGTSRGTGVFTISKTHSKTHPLPRIDVEPAPVPEYSPTISVCETSGSKVSYSQVSLIHSLNIF